MADLDAKQVATFVAVLGIIVVVLAVFFSVAVDIEADQTESVEYPTADQTERLVENLRVDDRTTAALTLGNGIELDNDDDLDLVSGDANLTDGPWSVAVSARVNNATNQTDVPRTLVSVDNGSLVVWYNNTTYHAYYTNGSHSATVNKTASGAGTYSPLVVRYDGSTLDLEEGEAVQSASLDTSTEPVPPLFDWVGSIDELRLFNESLTSSQVDQYLNQPVAPIDANTSVRYLFDEQDGGDVFAYYANETVGINGAQQTDGVGGPGLDRGTDFEATDGPPRVEVLSGGAADGAPVVFVTSPAGAFGGLLATIENLGSAAISLVALTAIMMAAGRVMGVFDEF